MTMKKMMLNWVKKNKKQMDLFQSKKKRR